MAKRPNTDKVTVYRMPIKDMPKPKVVETIFGPKSVERPTIDGGSIR